MESLSREKMLELIKERKIKAYRLDNEIVFKYKDVEKLMAMIEPEKGVDTSKYR